MADEVTTNEIMDFLKDNMMTKEEGATKQDLAKLKHDILDSMDEKLADLKGDLTILMRKEDKKVVELINVLKEKEVLSLEEAEKLLALEPFPQSP
ncbi:MAG: hypothetical protein ABIG32_02295 [Candidatus Uhrbacteria bacterium]|nr:hypothetical protein [Patescibacteria group bacterium]MBU1907006.1 hypothetical protein [Patescibacteria group bacterium]